MPKDPAMRIKEPVLTIAQHHEHRPQCSRHPKRKKKKKKKRLTMTWKSLPFSVNHKPVSVAVGFVRAYASMHDALPFWITH